MVSIRCCLGFLKGQLGGAGISCRSAKPAVDSWAMGDAASCTSTFEVSAFRVYGFGALTSALL